MTGYLLRRLLAMIPTYLGILLITFVVIRLQAPPFQEMSQAESEAGEAGALSGDQAAAPVEKLLGRFRRTGRDLPAVLNLRGFVGRERVVARLKESQRDGRPGFLESRRNRAEKELWLQGRLLVEPLLEVLADDQLPHLHGPASMALSLCAYRPLDEGDLTRLSAERRQQIQLRNRQLRSLRIEYRNEAPEGFVTTDPRAAEKRAALLALLGDDQDFARSGGTRWRALVLETGVVDFFRRLATGDLTSELYRRPVFALIAERWQVTFGLTLASILIAWSVSVPLGIRSARRRGTIEDRVTTAGLFALWSIPTFFVGTVLLAHLCTDSSMGVRWFPNRGVVSPDAVWYTPLGLLLDVAWHWFLPLLVLSYDSFTALSRYMRGSLLDQLSSDYVRTARAKGCDETRVVYGHALRNSMITMITLGSGLLSALFGGFLFVEVIFSIPGLGWLLWQAALNGDMPLLMGSTVISVGLLLVSILVADILYAVADPRIRSRYA